VPVRRFYERTIQGLMEKGGAGWKKLTGKGQSA